MAHFKLSFLSLPTHVDSVTAIVNNIVINIDTKHFCVALTWRPLSKYQVVEPMDKMVDLFFSLFCFFINLPCVCFYEYAQMCQSTHVEVRRQPMGIGFLLSPCKFWGLNVDC